MIRLRIPQNKYGAKKVCADNLVFDSAVEWRRYEQLKLLVAAGKIHSLDVHPLFVLQESFTDSSGKRWKPVTYRADFSYVEQGKVVVEEIKGYRSNRWRMVEPLFRYKFPSIDFRVIPAGDV